MAIKAIGRATFTAIEDYDIIFVLNGIRCDTLNFDSVRTAENAVLEADFFNGGESCVVDKAVLCCYDGEGSLLGSPVEVHDASSAVADGGSLYLSKDCKTITCDIYGGDRKLCSKGMPVIRNGSSVGVKAVSYKVINNVDAGAALNWDSVTTQATYPTQKPDKGKYCYVMTIVTYSDSTTTNTISTSYTPMDGNDGTSVKVKSTKVEYAGSDSGTSAPTSGWQPSVPSLAQGKYLWTRTTVVYSDDNSTTSYSVGRIGMDGDKGGTTHILYASSASPKSANDVRMTIDAFHQYYGTYEDTNIDDDVNKYTSVKSWVLIKGDTGNSAITHRLVPMADCSATVKASGTSTDAKFTLSYNLHYKAAKIVGDKAENAKIASIAATIEGNVKTTTFDSTVTDYKVSGTGGIEYNSTNRPADSIPVTVTLSDGTMLYDTVKVTMEAGVAIDINKNLATITKTLADQNGNINKIKNTADTNSQNISTLDGRVSEIKQTAESISLKVSAMDSVLFVESHQRDNTTDASHVDFTPNGSSKKSLLETSKRGMTWFLVKSDGSIYDKAHIYNTFDNASLCDTMASDLNNSRGNAGVLVVLSYDATSMTQKLIDELAWWGLDPASIAPYNKQRIAFAFVGEANLGRGRGLRSLASSTSGKAIVYARISNGHVVAHYDGGDAAQKSLLLDTGIDIENKKITMTADSTLVRSNNGTPIALFGIDASGAPFLNTRFINAESIAINRLMAFNGNTMLTSINYYGYGEFIQYYSDGKRKMEISDGNITYYNDDTNNSIKWVIGENGMSKSIDRWSTFKLAKTDAAGSNVKTTSSLIGETYSEFRAGDNSTNTKYSGLTVSGEQNGTSPTAAGITKIADGWYTYTMPPLMTVDHATALRTLIEYKDGYKTGQTKQLEWSL